MTAMREMHKWKDKVELSLDNRQIFFLFFGLSVVGCFVFALGVMVGRRVDFGQTGEVAALANDGLSLLEGDTAEEPPASLSFKDGLATPATDGVPPTRDPSQPPAEAEAEAEHADAKLAKGTTKPNPVAGGAEKPVLAKSAAGAIDKSAANKAIGPRQFTLQMKAFSRAEEAESFAAPLRANGHDVRVEAEEVKGRIWHRVRLGAFDKWEDGLAAKEAFESKEKVIAYVVRM